MATFVDTTCLQSTLRTGLLRLQKELSVDSFLLKSTAGWKNPARLQLITVRATDVSNVLWSHYAVYGTTVQGKVTVAFIGIRPRASQFRAPFRRFTVFILVRLKDGSVVSIDQSQDGHWGTCRIKCRPKRLLTWVKFMLTLNTECRAK